MSIRPAIALDPLLPLAIDLYCGLGGWTKGFLAEGYRVIGFDIEPPSSYPGDLILQDVLTLHGSQFRHAACIVASPPCQAYSYRAMPWKRAKALPPPSNELFDACFRIQREACEAAGHHIPMVVENVCGAQPWVGRAAWHYGSFYLWGDVPALMPFCGQLQKVTGYSDPRRNGGKGAHLTSQRENDQRKNSGGSWFAVAHNTTSGHSRNPVTGEGIKQHGSGPEWFDQGIAHFSSAGLARKSASAQIAEIPLELAQHIARCFAQPRVERLYRRIDAGRIST